MQKIYVEFNYIIEDEVDGKKIPHEVRIQCHPNTPIKVAKEAMFIYLKDLGQIEDSAKANQEQLEREKADASKESEQLKVE